MCSITSGIIEPARAARIAAAEWKRALIKGAANRRLEQVKRRKLNCESRMARFSSNPGGLVWNHPCCGCPFEDHCDPPPPLLLAKWKG
ncbi:hypothetical protein MHYP_G00155690 [Metynnis hypsauchen]